MNRFNVRVYGILIKDGCLLVTDEIRYDIKMTKLPGGGLEYGEGIEEGLKREWMEELEAEVEVGSVVYVNPFLQVSIFRDTDQVICMYFLIKNMSELKGKFTEKVWDFEDKPGDQQLFRWIPVEELSEDTFTFPIDKAMVKELVKSPYLLGSERRI
jgi:8-oxo-dGTP diphosphatase